MASIGASAASVKNEGAQVTAINIRLQLLKKSIENVKRAGMFDKAAAAEIALDDAAALFSEMVDLINFKYKGV